MAAWRKPVTHFRRSLLAVTLLLGLAGPLHAQRLPVGAALMQFEEAVTWEAVSPDWRRIRPGWVQQLATSGSWEQVRALMLQLEANMGWQAVQGSWRRRRDGWVAEAQAARGPADVARLLLELEAVTSWSAVNDSWRGARPSWVAQVSAVAGGGGSPTK
jgi:hypothetical protein